MTSETQLRVLVVDDEAPARRKILRLLRAESGIQVVGEADSGDAAIAAIEKLIPDLVFLDVQMPVTDGFAVVQALSANSRPDHVARPFPATRPSPSGLAG